MLKSINRAPMTRSLRPPPWTPTAEDYSRIFTEQNPWHQQGAVPDELAPRVERPLASHLARLLTIDQPRRYQLVLGPRRVGKSTAMYQMVRRLLGSGVPPHRVWWLRLDHPLLMRVRLDVLVQTI